MTHSTASDILDFPDPFGPTIIVTSFSKKSVVFSGKDLKPWISSAFKYIRLSLSLQNFLPVETESDIKGILPYHMLFFKFKRPRFRRPRAVAA